MLASPNTRLRPLSGVHAARDNGIDSSGAAVCGSAGLDEYGKRSAAAEANRPVRSRYSDLIERLS